MDLMKVVSISVAGGFGGMAGIVSGYPLDTLRIRQQQHCNSGSAFAILRQIVATQCPGGLYRGMGASLASVTFQNVDSRRISRSCKLGLLLSRRFSKKKTTSTNSIFRSKVHHGILDCLHKSIKQGYSVLWRGLGTAVSRAFVVNGAVFATYEELSLRCLFSNGSM